MIDDTDLQMLPGTNPISLKGWDFGFGGLNPLVADAAAEALQGTLTSDPFLPWASLPFAWAPKCNGQGGPAVTDPGTIYVHFASLCPEGEDSGPTFSTSLSALVRYFLEFADTPELLSALRDHLRQLADGIDAEMAKNESETGKLSPKVENHTP